MKFYTKICHSEDAENEFGRGLCQLEMVPTKWKIYVDVLLNACTDIHLAVNIGKLSTNGNRM